VTSAELSTLTSAKMTEIENRIRNGYNGRAELKIGETFEGAHFVLHVPNVHAFEPFRRLIAVGNEFVRVMIKCGDARFT